MQSPEQKRVAAEARRSVRPHFTPIQTRQLIDYLEEKRQIEALGTVLNYALRELQDALDTAAREQLWGNGGR